jgi:flavin reductase (DIM6/NTAB) family NADH-FMN oxidoreductase RutF
MYPHLYPKPVALIGSLAEGKPNFLTMSDIMTSGYQIPRFILSSGKNHHTNKGIIKNEAFSVNVPSTSHLKETDFCGIYTGKKEDKSKIFEIFYGNKIKTAPFIKKFPINHACKLVKTIDFGDTHYIFVGEIIETYVHDDYLVDDKVNVDKLEPISYCKIDRQYRTLGERIGQAYKVGRLFKAT